MDFDYSTKTKELQQRVLAFMDEHIYPAETEYAKELAANTTA
ncbi:MAG: acyl-CoA dehydrogenase, partial [Gammaproteobacteria bacterium]|nr:acyl-CoA dehydrogenase [Gammaproteobacteria bacterium]